MPCSTSHHRAQVIHGDIRSADVPLAGPGGRSRHALTTLIDDPAAQRGITAHRRRAPSAPPLTVIVADDHPLVRNALLRTLTEDGRFDVLGQAADGRDAVALAEELAPDLAVLDVRMPVLDGLQALEAITEHVPRTRVILLSAFDDEIVRAAALAAGAAGYLTKDTERDVICDRLARAARGETVVDQHGSGAAARPDGEPPELTARERNVLLLVSQEWNHNIIAMLLGIPVAEVDRHTAEAVDKLEAADAEDAVDVARAWGLLP
jgi:two-component system nitrate/nitrite response regulator NarL